MKKTHFPLMPSRLLVTTDTQGFGAPGAAIEMEPLEAEALGAFEEVALSLSDAAESSADLGGDDE